MNTLIRRHIPICFAAALAINLLGCEGAISIVPNNDPALRKAPTAFAADSAKRLYEDNAPKVPDSAARADYALMLKQVELANISDQDWSNVEVWINGKYVVYCPNFSKKTDKSLYFRMFFDSEGHHFDTQGGKNPLKTLEIFRDGTMYTVTNHVADLERASL